MLKRKDFARWQSGEKLSDTALCKAVQEMEGGLIDADLAGHLYKKRVARPGAGKSGGYRTLLSAKDLVKALQAGVLLEVCCDEQNH
ncbi:type II toxin-antitoxin system RelE/ParE family toxin [Billgrantia endophytica]|uniref:Type II toxin-antitoxin system RelE/ParE family toxin n=1 Tax=Billgrantia endophytica TaxID=2033802 RepID=A0A2N7TXV9_9GAMM|nr:type II toxin-antitoxin system RelE/ParE family toxin [Halomonas endophytica]PMR72995.1 hypothetical protein C1H69_19175 [Halomonas endophytica]